MRGTARFALSIHIQILEIVFRVRKELRLGGNRDRQRALNQLDLTSKVYPAGNKNCQEERLLPTRRHIGTYPSIHTRSTRGIGLATRHSVTLSIRQEVLQSFEAFAQFILHLGVAELE